MNLEKNFMRRYICGFTFFYVRTVNHQTAEGLTEEFFSGNVSSDSLLKTLGGQQMKKPLLIIAFVLFIGFVLFLYNGLNGNPVSKFLAKKELESYLEETYPSKELTVNDGLYNFKYGGYEFKVKDIGSAGPRGIAKTYDFSVYGSIVPKVNYDEIYIENLDERLARVLNNQFVEEISPMILEKVDSLHYIGTHIEVLKGRYPEGTEWSKDLTFEQPMDIFIQLDSTEQTAKDFLSDSIEIKSILDEQGYNYEKLNFNGIAFESEVKDEHRYYLKFSVSSLKDGEIKEKNIEEHNVFIWK